MIIQAGTVFGRERIHSGTGGEGRKMNGHRQDWERLGFLSADDYEFPNIVNVEVYRSRCPCRCRHCPVGLTPPARRASRFGEQGMDLSLFARILDEISRHAGKVLRVHSVGEPLLWEDLVPALAMCKEKGVATWLFTSAVSRRKDLLADVFRNADIVEVSVNARDRRDYMATKGVDEYDLVCDNIRFFKGLWEKGIGKRLVVSRVQSKDPREDELFVMHWKKTGLVHDAFVRTYHSYNGLLGPRGLENGDGGRRPPCLVHWARFNIGVGGQAVVCFNELFRQELDESSLLGDLNHDSIKQIWKGPELAALRKAELEGDFGSLSKNGSTPCAKCRFFQPLQGDGQTSEHQVRQLG